MNNRTAASTRPRVTSKKRHLMLLVSMLAAALAVGALPSRSVAATMTRPSPATQCPQSTRPDEATCQAIATLAAPPVSTSVAGRMVAGTPRTSSKVGDYTPADLASLYGLTATQERPASAPTIAIVDAGSDPDTEANLAAFRATYGLPACTTANGCFREVDQRGGTDLPATMTSWQDETALDVEAVSSICQTCHILLVDADDNYLRDLGAATATAVRLGALYVSLSFVGTENSDTANYAPLFTAPGVTFVAASGDGGFKGSTWPSVYPDVVSAGGTSARLVNGLWEQTAWTGTQTGCSTLTQTASTAAQRAATQGGCGQARAAADISALADPHTGLLVYRDGLWYDMGGTSLATPILTSLYALAGNHGHAFDAYDHPDRLLDIATGTTKGCDSATNRVCTAATGWDGPTGIGTPYDLTGVAADGASVPVTTHPATLTLSNPGTRRLTLGRRATWKVVANQPGSYAKTVTGLPRGLRWNPVTGQVTGKPKRAGHGTAIFTFTGTPAFGAGATTANGTVAWAVQKTSSARTPSHSHRGRRN